MGKILNKEIYQELKRRRIGENFTEKEFNEILKYMYRRREIIKELIRLQKQLEIVDKQIQNTTIFNYYDGAYSELMSILNETI